VEFEGHQTDPEKSLKWKAVLQSAATLGARVLSNLHPVKI
jgi:hypothetical protein